MMVNGIRSKGGAGGLPEKQWIGRSFGKAAICYDGLSGLQRATADALLFGLFERMADALPAQVVDVGAGTGYPTQYLLEHWPNANVLVLDLAEGMLQVARHRLSRYQQVRLICGDAENLPLANLSTDLIYSNLALQWCTDLPTVLAEFWRVLKPGGRLVFSTFGTQTLTELKKAWATVDAYSHVMNFQSVEDIRAAFASSGWGDCEVHSVIKPLEYPSVHALMRELKGLGAHNITHDRPRHLQGKSALRQMVATYEASYEGNGIVATFELISAYCCKRP